MNNQQKKAFNVLGFGDTWTKNMMEREKEEIVFMFKIIGTTNLKLVQEVREKDNIIHHLREQIRILSIE